MKVPEDRIMRSTLGLLRWITCCLTVLLVAGCSGAAVQEDRSINYSTDGDDVGFQHGEDGIFVASSVGDKLEKVYDGGEDTIAVSSPLWSPVDKRLIFTSARSANPEDNQVATEIAAWDSDPEGRRFQPEEVIYTCMLRAAPDENAAPGENETQPPTALFEAACDHPGYVAANVAVRWHPAGDRVLFVDRTDGNGHGLFEFDLVTKETRQILPQSAAALIFDWTPGGSFLVCVLASGVGDPEVDGIWIRPTEEEEWWRAPESEFLAGADSEAILERLRSTRPAWTDDERQFAFVVHHAPSGAPAGGEGLHEILAIDAGSREVSSLYESKSRIRDLHWNPRTHQLGFIEEGTPAALRFVDETGAVSDAVNEESVRRFAGWSHDGARLAYIVPERHDDSAEQWALLFPPVPDARDDVYVAAGTGDQPGSVVHSGVRITFPLWSPTEDSLSLWGTYTPTHRSLLSTFLPWTLHPGDPAAILNCQTGEMSWMAVNAQEEAQVGHYYLLNRDYEQAWQWYQRSVDDREPAGPIKLSRLDQFLRQLRTHQDASFFEYYCLTKLQRPDEAAAWLEQFRHSMTFDTEDVGDLFENWQLSDEELRAELAGIVAFATPLIQNSYITEVYLSLEAAADGVTFFERELAEATADTQRLASALCLSQLLLVLNDRQAYAEFSSATLAPLLMRLIEGHNGLREFNFNNLAEARRQAEQATLISSGALALRPMMSTDFLNAFSGEQLRVYLSQWRRLGDEAQNDVERLGVDLVLVAILTQLGDDERREVEERIQANPHGADFRLTFPEPSPE
jgi:Tol biopolymer transport system component